MAAGGTRSDRIVRIVFGAVAAVLVVLAFSLPVWQARLEVLQYPNRQLVLTAYGDRLEGDVDEVTILNHYVGVKVFNMAELAETVLWIPALIGSILLIGAATFLAGWWRRGAVALLWLIPLGVLADIQFRLYQMGHNMDPAAAFDQEPFTPWVVGRVQVSSNVATIAWPGEALWCLFGAAALITFGPMYWGFVKEFVTAGRTDEGSLGTDSKADEATSVSG
jgi:hypothetical protein